MFRSLLYSLISLLLIGCAGRPPAPINNYGSPTSNRQGLPSRPTGSTSSVKPPLPGTGTAPTVKPGKATGSSTAMSGQEIFKKCNSAVFMIFTSTGYADYQGSGFFISSDGLAVSNYHVFEGTGMGLEAIKLVDDRRFKIKEVIRKDKTNDIMIFRVALPNGTQCNYIPLSKRNPQVGDKVYAIGSPRGLENTFSSGEISQFRDGNLIQISVPIDHGSSGGALINEYGEAIGITSAGLDDSGANLNFAVSTNAVRRHLNQ